MAIIIEQKKDLFEYAHKMPIVHCISSDFAMGAGIAVSVEKEFNLREKFSIGQKWIYPNVIFVSVGGENNSVFSLVTKKRYYDKPTYKTMFASLMKLFSFLYYEENSITEIAMPRIDCGLDRLSWGRVKPMIEATLEPLDITVYVCYL